MAQGGGNEDGVGAPLAPTGLLAMSTATAAAFVANLYYAQPLAPYISAELHIRQSLAGSIVSASQFGYGIGLFLLVPLADSIENRRLVLVCVAIVFATLIGLATARSAMTFLFFGAATGIFSSAAQILIPYLSRILPSETRGRAVGYVTSGILASVMLARPLALFVTATIGWRAIYWMAAALTLLLAIGLSRTMTRSDPRARISYIRIIGSMFAAYAANGQVRRRTVYQAMIFASFTMFWAVVPILLNERFRLSPVAIGLFALAGAGGALSSPIAGRIADNGRGALGMTLASLAIAVSFGLSACAIHYGSLIGLVIAAVLIDGAVQACQTFSRLIVLEVDPGIRGRVNALYMTLVYTSGALGSILGVFLYAWTGWGGVAALGAILAFATCCAVTGDARRRASAITRNQHA